jgi:hypothetical protein
MLRLPHLDSLVPYNENWNRLLHSTELLIQKPPEGEIDPWELGPILVSSVSYPGSFIRNIYADARYKGGRYFPSSEAPFIYLSLVDRYHFAKTSKAGRCFCGRQHIYWYMRNMNLFIPGKRLHWAATWFYPKCLNDSRLVFLYQSWACSPICSLMYRGAYQTRSEVYNRISKDKVDEPAYNLAFYTQMCKMAFKISINEVFEGFELWDGRARLQGNKFRFFQDMFWKLYTFTLLLAYKSSIIPGDDRIPEVEIPNTTIGFNWFNFEPDANMNHNLERVLYEYIDVLSAAMVHAHVQTVVYRSQVSRKRMDKVEADYVFYDSIIDFLKSSEKHEAIVLQFAIDSLEFNPFRELEIYYRERKHPDMYPEHKDRHKLATKQDIATAHHSRNSVGRYLNERGSRKYGNRDMMFNSKRRKLLMQRSKDRHARFKS